jgi:hypothetical protein
MNDQIFQISYSPERKNFYKSLKPVVKLIFFIGLILNILLTLYSSTDSRHWFIIPVLMCGIITGNDVINWLFTKNIFDPKGLLGLFSFHFFYISPLLHVKHDFWMEYIVPPPDWRIWIGYMAIFNIIGLIIYQTSYRLFPKPNKKNKVIWELSVQKFPIVIIFFLLVSAVLQVIVYIQSGGIQGYINSFTESGDTTFTGFGWMFMISESFPILFAMAYGFLSKSNTWTKNMTVIFIFLSIEIIFLIFFGGLRGSRLNIIWGLIWITGIIHFWVKPFTKKQFILGLIFIILFMYIYGFYKAKGLDGVTAAIRGGEEKVRIEQTYNRGIYSTLLGDLGRTDVQAFILYKLVEREYQFDYGNGRTYLGAISLMIPSKLWPDRPLTKLKEGTEIQYGTMYPSELGGKTSSRIYGLGGEALLNFGPLLIPISYILLGIYVKLISNLNSNLSRWDSRKLILPFLVTLSFLILGSDSDNVLFTLIKNGFIPILVVIISSKKYISAEKVN